MVNLVGKILLTIKLSNAGCMGLLKHMKYFMPYFIGSESLKLYKCIHSLRKYILSLN